MNEKVLITICFLLYGLACFIAGDIRHTFFGCSCSACRRKGGKS